MDRSEQIHNLYLEMQSGLSAKEINNENKNLILSVISDLDQGQIRVAEPPQKAGDPWKINSWMKEAILLYFRITHPSFIEAGDLQFFDRIPVKSWEQQKGVRVVPPAIARKGSFLAQGVILMPSFVNIGAYVDSETMVDTWATVGSCAQIGKRVHLSGGVGIGGVLEPVQAAPVIIEDDVFIGSRCIVVEGVHVQQGAVLGAGLILTASTKILDVTQPDIFTGSIPPQSVVIPGTLPKKFPAGEFGVPCALIIGKRKESTDKKTSLTEVLRLHQVSV